MGTVTLQTIADRVGVSRTTVSNAFSRPDQLSAQLRDRIHEVATELGYAGPDPVARSLRSGQVGAIGVLLTESLGYTLRDPYTASLLTGLAEATGAADNGLLLVPLPPGRAAGEVVRNAVVDGFVLFNLPRGHPAVPLVRSRSQPLVTVDGPRLEGVPMVSIDDRAAAAELAGRVYAAGHRRVLVLTFRVVDDDRTGVVDDDRIAAATYEVSRQRVLGVRAAADRAGVDPADVVIVEVAENRPDVARHTVRQALAGDPSPTAVIALSDRLALDVMTELADAGRRVPADVSVTGYDDIEAAAGVGLTTVRQSALDKGRVAAQILTGDRAATDVTLPYELQLRRTLGPAPR